MPPNIAHSEKKTNVGISSILDLFLIRLTKFDIVQKYEILYAINPLMKKMLALENLLIYYQVQFQLMVLQD